jgi:hypothetical protein
VSRLQIVALTILGAGVVLMAIAYGILRLYTKS